MSGVRLEVRGVGHRYGESEVLFDLDLEVAPGEFLAIVGRSGSGKTTLLRLFVGLEQPLEGEIHQDGSSVIGLNRRARLMFQDARLLPWERVAGNVGLGLSREHSARIMPALSQV